jgi:hypothetical protein
MQGIGYRSSVTYSGEFRRIEGLPRRTAWWTEGPRLEKVTTTLVRDLAERGGKMTLWPVQAAALHDIVLNRGSFLPIGVGQGKALISLLAAVVLEVQRPLLLVPAQLREQTLSYVIPRMREHWKLPPGLRVVGYSELSLAKNAKLLEEMQPDLVILDECHRVKNLKAGRTRRLLRWFRQHPETLCVAMSGTISNRSIRDFAHIIKWCLHEGSPLPDKWTELMDWADALDEKVPDQQRVAPGALNRFCQPDENPRQGFRRRLTETPGVVATTESQLGTSIRIDSYPLHAPRSIVALADGMRTTWMTPNGAAISEAVELWRHMRELALGFWYRWDPPAPRDWLEARSDWKKWVRETLAHNQRGLDTELQVWMECQSKELPSEHPWLRWRELKGIFAPKAQPEWVSSFAVDACRRWLRERTPEDPGICWIEHVAFGKRLEEVSGLPFFGAGDSKILDCTAPAIIASQLAHAEGKNLQRYSRNLVTSPMASGKSWEQLLGRTHREGQTADEVVCEVFVHVPELLDSFGQALDDARYLEDTFGNRQKLNFADVTIKRRT